MRTACSLAYCLFERADVRSGMVPCIVAGPPGRFFHKSLVSSMPVVGNGSPSRLAIYRGGSLPGSTYSVHLSPETCSAVVVLQNSAGLCDAADWISQLLVERLFGGAAMPNDILQLVSQAAVKCADIMLKIERDLNDVSQRMSPTSEIIRWFRADREI